MSAARADFTRSALDYGIGVVRWAMYAGSKGQDPAYNCRRDPAYTSRVVTDGRGGALIAVKVIARASSSAVAGIRDGALLVRLNAAPVDGAANAELLEVIASALGVPKRAITIRSGETSRRKTLLIAGMSAAAVLTKLNV